MSDKILYSPAELNDLIAAGRVVPVDVRDAEEYAAGHIPGAVSAPDIFYYLSTTTPEGLQEIQSTFGDLFSRLGVARDQIALLYEDGLASRYGGSCRGYWLLSYLGHPQVGILDGGLMAWREAGFSLSTKATARPAVDYQVTPNEALLATKADVVAALDNPSVVLLDNRDAVEWRGESSSPYGVDFAPRKGRIPGARWIEWYRFMETEAAVPGFKSPAEIQALCAEQGITPNDDIIIYCFKGARASNTFVALKEAGFSKLRNYFGSWNEWSRDESLPIESGAPVESAA